MEGGDSGPKTSPLQPERPRRAPTCVKTTKEEVTPYPDVLYPLELPPQPVGEPLDPERERILVGRAAAGDRRAYGRLYRAHHGRVYGAALRMVRDPSLAEDVTQEAFIAAWRALPSIRDQEAFPSWIYGVAVRTALRALRTERRHHDRNSRWATDRYEAALVRSVADLQIDLERAMAALPHRARATLLLQLAGLDHGEIAEELGIRRGTVKSQLHRARRLALEELGR